VVQLYIIVLYVSLSVLGLILYKRNLSKQSNWSPLSVLCQSFPEESHDRPSFMFHNTLN